MVGELGAQQKVAESKTHLQEDNIIFLPNEHTQTPLNLFYSFKQESSIKSQVPNQTKNKSEYEIGNGTVDEKD